METGTVRLGADEPQIDGLVGIVYVYEIGFIVFDLIESAGTDSATRIVGRVREIVHPIPHGLAVDEVGYILIDIKSDVCMLRQYYEVCLCSEQPVLSQPQEEKGGV